MPNKSNLAFFESCLAMKIWAWQFGIFGTFYLVWQLTFMPVITYGVTSTYQCDVF